jgi:AraC-like DNA-binding protein
MKEIDPICFKVPRIREETVRVEYWDLPYFYDSVHYHEECQLSYILEGHGTVLVVDKVEKFAEGDLIFIGKNTPHVLLMDDEYHQGSRNLRARAITIFFSRDTFNQVFNSLPEAMQIEKFLEQAEFGIRIRHEEANRISGDIKKFQKLTQVPRIILFLKILDLMTRKLRYDYISTTSHTIIHAEDNLKIRKVFDHVTRNFDRRISLEEVADLVNLTPTAFCRFFKLRTNKTFSKFLIEVRINQACKLLSDVNFNVTETYYSCGYNNSSNFHRHFRHLTGLTPSEYREKVLSHYRMTQFA